MTVVIEAKNIGKKYRIGEREQYLALRDTLTFILKSPLKWLMSKVKSSDPKNIFWALQDINFKVEEGEVLGIIGRNGAGKSTLLKILSRITPPTTGEIKMQGRVGSLLEVGTGFHPELTGRENIYLNGAVLGMRKKEIEKKFDEIVEFSGIGQFLDTPVKRYSSGMYVRLAFSVAAHLEPDILIVDEVLAVGDIEFQKKCLGKMEEVTKKEGRTVLFVSHNMGAIKELCSRTILLENGKIKEVGETFQVVHNYINDISAVKESKVELSPSPQKEISFTKVWITNSKDEITNSINIEDDFKIWLEYNVDKPIDIAEISICLKNSSGTNVIFTSISDSFNKTFIPFQKGKYTSSAHFKGNFLMPDNYLVYISSHIRGTRGIDVREDVIRLIINETGKSAMAPYGQVGNYWSCVLGDIKWDYKKIN